MQREKEKGSGVYSHCGTVSYPISPREPASLFSPQCNASKLGDFLFVIQSSMPFRFPSWRVCRA